MSLEIDRLVDQQESKSGSQLSQNSQKEKNLDNENQDQVNNISNHLNADILDTNIEKTAKTQKNDLKSEFLDLKTKEFTKSLQNNLENENFTQNTETTTKSLDEKPLKIHEKTSKITKDLDFYEQSIMFDRCQDDKNVNNERNMNLEGNQENWENFGDDTLSSREKLCVDKSSTDLDNEEFNKNFDESDFENASKNQIGFGVVGEIGMVGESCGEEMELKGDVDLKGDLGEGDLDSDHQNLIGSQQNLQLEIQNDSSKILQTPQQN